MSEFTDVMIKSYEIVKADKNPLGMTSMLHWLSNLDVFPEEQLKEFFTVEVMEYFDRHVQGTFHDENFWSLTTYY